MINRLSEAIGDAQPIVSLRLKSRRAVVYRGPRLGASTGLAHHPLGRSCGVALVNRWALREPRPTKAARFSWLLTDYCPLITDY